MADDGALLLLLLRLLRLGLRRLDRLHLLQQHVETVGRRLCLLDLRKDGGVHRAVEGDDFASLRLIFGGNCGLVGFGGRQICLHSGNLFQQLRLAALREGLGIRVLAAEGVVAVSDFSDVGEGGQAHGELLEWWAADGALRRVDIPIMGRFDGNGASVWPHYWNDGAEINPAAPAAFPRALRWARC